MLGKSAEEAFVLTEKEMDRLSVIRCVIGRKLTWLEAARQLDLSKRQIGNLVSRVRKEGSSGVIHRLKNRPSNNQLPAGSLQEALKLVQLQYPDFGPTFASEKLQENHHIVVSRETLRKGMIHSGAWQPRQRKPKHRSWRPRRLCVGELVQLDGSYHDWFEGRGPIGALVAYIDDATSNILYAKFVEGEDTLTLFKTTQAYLERWGRPKALYADKHAVYHVNKQTMVEPHLRDPQPMTQFTRAMAELGIEVIAAHSPQAKGRVERAFGTLQDRLVKEMRLQGISNVFEANRFLLEEFIPDYNQRFGVLPANPLDAHRPLLPTHNLDEILSFKTQRRVMNNFTVRFQNRLFQLLKDQPVRILPRDKVLVEIHINGSIRLVSKGKELDYKPIIAEKSWWEKLYPELQRPPQDFRLPGSSKSLFPALPSYWQTSWLFEDLKLKIEQNAKLKGEVSTLQK